MCSKIAWNIFNDLMKLLHLEQRNKDAPPDVEAYPPWMWEGWPGNGVLGTGLEGELRGGLTSLTGSSEAFKRIRTLIPTSLKLKFKSVLLWGWQRQTPSDTQPGPLACSLVETVWASSSFTGSAKAEISSHFEVECSVDNPSWSWHVSPLLVSWH